MGSIWLRINIAKCQQIWERPQTETVVHIINSLSICVFVPLDY